MTDAVAKGVPSSVTKKDLELLSNLLVEGESYEAICEIMDFSKETLNAILAEERFKEFVVQHKKDEIADDFTVDDQWRKLEQKSLQRAIELTNTMDSPESAARVAAIANKTAQRRKPAPTSATIERTVMTIPQDALAARFDDMDKRQKEILDAAPRRSADVVSVQDIEGFMGLSDADK